MKNSKMPSIHNLSFKCSYLISIEPSITKCNQHRIVDGAHRDGLSNKDYRCRFSLLKL